MLFRSLGQKHMAGFDLGRLRHHALDLAAVRLHPNGAGHANWEITSQILQQRQSGPRPFDQDGFGTVLCDKPCDLAPKVGVLEPRAKDVDEVVIRLDHPPEMMRSAPRPVSVPPTEVA